MNKSELILFKCDFNFSKSELIKSSIVEKDISWYSTTALISSNNCDCDFSVIYSRLHKIFL